MCVCGHIVVYSCMCGVFYFNFIFKFFTNFNSDDYVAIPFVKMPRERPTAVFSLNS